MHRRSRMRASIGAAALPMLAGCTRTGVNAGEEGGTAFVLFTVMLILTAVILWFILGREE